MYIFDIHIITNIYISVKGIYLKICTDLSADI